MGFYRKSCLLMKGLLYETKNGYEDAAKFFIDSDLDVDVNGVVFLITGANSGIGFETAKAVAKRGAIVHLVCRNLKRANKAKTILEEETGNKEIYVHILELTQIKEVQKFVDKYIEDHGKLDVLINNAGESCESFQTTDSENLERSFATNVVGPYALTKGLIPLLKRSTNTPRVVTVGSAGMLLQKLDVHYFDKILHHYDGIITYGQCKRQMAIFMEIWADEHPEIQFSVMHPGWVDTPAARRGLGEFFEKMKDKFRSPEEGADTVVWLAISKEALKARNGTYFQDRKPAAKHLPLARTKEKLSDRNELRRMLKGIMDDVERRK